MSELNMQPGSYLETLLAKTDENELYLELGRYLQANITNLTLNKEFQPAGSAKEGFIDDELIKYAKMTSKGLEKSLHSFCCEEEGGDLRKMLATAFKLGKKNAAEILTIIIASKLLLTANIAAILAAIILFAFTPVYEDFCEGWAKRLALT